MTEVLKRLKQVEQSARNLGPCVAPNYLARLDNLDRLIADVRIAYLLERGQMQKKPLAQSPPDRVE